MSGSGSGDARDTDTETELGRDRAGGEVDAVMDGYRWGVAPVAEEELPDLRTLVWKAAVSGSATMRMERVATRASFVAVMARPGGLVYGTE